MQCSMNRLRSFWFNVCHYFSSRNKENRCLGYVKSQNKAIQAGYTCLVGLVIAWPLAMTAQSADILPSLRGHRYCEILLATSPQEIHVYNTVGLNECPAEQWDRLSLQQIKQETNALYIHFNGPRYWVIDSMPNSHVVNPAIRTLGGIPMREVGVLHVTIRDLNGSKPYTAHEVERDTTWFYQAGKPIYELIDPKGNAFVMQSYSLQKVPQTEVGLSDLADHLHLPTGWNFRTRVLPTDAHLTPVERKAIVIQDDFLNTYQQETPDFIRTTTSNR